MSAVALSKSSSLSASLAGPATAAETKALPAKGFFTRVLDAIIAARTLQAEREITRYMALRGSYFRR